MKDVIVIGFAGGTSCGKTTMIRKIKEEFGDDIAVLSHDFYYNCLDHLTFEERCKVNYDHPRAFETDLMIKHVKDLIDGKTIERPVYDFTVHNRAKETVTVYPAKVVVIEGILIFENKELRDLCDIKVYIDTDDDVRILRRLLRDTTERGRTVESVIEQYLTTVKPMHQEFIEPTKKYADIIVPEGGQNVVALEMLKERIHALLRERA